MPVIKVINKLFGSAQKWALPQLLQHNHPTDPNCVKTLTTYHFILNPKISISFTQILSKRQKFIESLILCRARSGRAA